MIEDISNKVVAVVIALIMVTVVALPILNDAANAKGPVEASESNTAVPTFYLEDVNVSGDLVIEVGSTTITVNDTAVTADKYYIADSFALFIDVSENEFYVYKGTKTTYDTTDDSVTIKKSGLDEDGTVTTYKMLKTNTSTASKWAAWSTFTTPVNVNESQKVGYLSSTAYAYNVVDDLSGVTAAATEDHDDVMAISAASGIVFAPVAFTFETIDYLATETERTIIGILPLLMVIAVLIACVGMFMSRSR